MSLQHAMIKGSRRIGVPSCPGDGAGLAFITETPARATSRRRLPGAGRLRCKRLMASGGSAAAIAAIRAG
jgi:hypothetical protein